MKDNVPDNPVTTIEQATFQGPTLMNHDFSCETYKTANGRFIFRGALTFGSVVIGRGIAMNKKECKSKTYQMALDRLKTLHLSDLIVSVPDEGLPECVSVLSLNFVCYTAIAIQVMFN